MILIIYIEPYLFNNKDFPLVQLPLSCSITII